ncbi:lipid A export ATP-binding/permease protein MsbA [Flavobacteriaceae bacterium UJ101]|nr:lipid A export ATP-binding/permease protein MsbA [Flavobacteriaceae bacterium UJ101]
MSALKRAISYTKPYTGSFSLSILFNTVYAILNVLAMAMMMPVLGIMFDEEYQEVKKPIYDGFSSLGDYAKESVYYLAQNIKEERGVLYTLAFFCIAFLIIFFLRNFFRFLGQIFLISLKTGVTKDFRNAIHQKILDLPVSFFTEKRKGDMMSRISSDVSEVESSILGSIIEIVRSPIMIIIYLVSLFLMNPQLTLFALLIFPALGTFISLLGKSLKRGSKRTQDQLGKVISNVEETLSGLKIIKIFNADKQVQGKFEESTSLHQNFLARVLRRNELASPVSEFLGAILLVIIIYYGGRLQISGEGMKGSEFVAYIGLFYTLLDPIKRFSKGFSNINKGRASAERIFEIIDTDVSIKDHENALSKQSFDSNITFENVYFQYDEKEVIQNFNLTLPKGKTIALVGSSGSGKSTLANLITRFYDVTKGSINIDQQNIKDIKLNDYRQLFGMVTQESILFNDTVFNNLILGKPDATLEEVTQAAKIANAHEFIMKLENGYQTNIGEGGGKLSGGQKQRMSIARAVLANPPIMILDEATSALDSHSEKLVQEALDNMMKDRTSLVIAHRLSTIQNADLIVVMEEGKIIEQGSHSELIDQKGAYKKLIELQNIAS